MMKNNLRKTIDYVGYSSKKEINKITLFSILGIALSIISYIAFKNMKITLSFTLLPVLYIYLKISGYYSKEKTLSSQRDDELISVISYFQIFITNRNNVYQSFKKVLPYCTDWMKESITNMLKEIDGDKTVQPYMNFANKFKTSIASNILLSIYSMVDQGESYEQINQFQILFEQLNKSAQIEKINKKQRGLSILGGLPLVGAAGITIVLTVAVISIIGELINVL